MSYYDVPTHDTRDGQAKRTRVHLVRARAQNPSIYEKFPGYPTQPATQFSGIFPEISGWLVGTYESFAG